MLSLQSHVVRELSEDEAEMTQMSGNDPCDGIAEAAD